MSDFSITSEVEVVSDNELDTDAEITTIGNVVVEAKKITKDGYKVDFQIEKGVVEHLERLTQRKRVSCTVTMTGLSYGLLIHAIRNGGTYYG